MKHSTLEIDLQDYKESKIQELDDLLEKESNEINSYFEKEKKELEEHFNMKFDQYSKSYSYTKLNQAKKEAKLIELKAITQAKKELENTLVLHFKDSFTKIITNLVPQVEKVLNTNSNNMILNSSKEFFNLFKETSLFKQVVEDNSLNKTEVIFYYNNELVRFNLRDEIRRIIEEEIGGHN